MRMPTRSRRHGLQFNITPLIDIIFLLIIFFLAVSHFVRSESFEPVDLPEATQNVDQDEQSPQKLVVTVKQDGSTFISGVPAEFVDVEQRIIAGHVEAGEKFEVRIRGDKNVPFKKIKPLMLACARAGVGKFGFKVLPK